MCPLFFLSFPLCRGEAGQLSLRCMATVVIFLNCSLLLSFSLHFLTPLSFLGLSSHNALILAVVFFVFCNLLVSLFQIFSVITRLSFLLIYL